MNRKGAKCLNMARLMMFHDGDGIFPWIVHYDRGCEKYRTIPPVGSGSIDIRSAILMLTTTLRTTYVYCLEGVAYTVIDYEIHLTRVRLAALLHS